MSGDVNLLNYSNILIGWYNENKRGLPWRDTKNPYYIWISEIILQQTRVAQGYDFYLRFIERFPDIKSLAEAEQTDVLKYWQGLGYYSRARNLHEAAKDIMSRFRGVFPSDYDDIISLKGIGEYTAAAIISIVWDQPYPVLDGNVFRVLSRLFAIDIPIDTGKGKKEIMSLANSLIDPKHAALYNQAIMEFGALQCTPRNPACNKCPLVNSCLGYLSGKVQLLPVKQNKTKTRTRYLNYFYITYEGWTYLQRRSKKDIWEGLFEFPLIESDQMLDLKSMQSTQEFKSLLENTDNPTFSGVKSRVKHILSHQTLYVTFYKVKIQKENDFLKRCIKISISDIGDYPVSKLIDSYLSAQF